YHVPLSIFERIQLAVAIADQLFNFIGRFAGMGLAAVERRHLMSATECIPHLIWAGESRAARMRMRIGLAVFSANKDVDVARNATALAVHILRKRRRSIPSI